MNSLHSLVESGKVLYLGVSDTPAWIVAAANTYAIQAHKTPFSVYQGRWNVMKRDLEYEILPMCQHFGMALCPWEVVGAGRLQTKKMMEKRKAQGENIRGLHGSTALELTEEEQKMSDALEKVADELKIQGQGDFSITAVAIAYVMHKARYCYPIIGGRKVEHLLDNAKALEIELSEEQLKFLEEVNPAHVPFPWNFIGKDPHETGASTFMQSSTAHLKWQTNGKPV